MRNALSIDGRKRTVNATAYKAMSPQQIENPNSVDNRTILRRAIESCRERPAKGTLHLDCDARRQSPQPALVVILILAIGSLC